MTADLPRLVAAFTARLRGAGVDVSVEQAARFDRAITTLDPTDPLGLYRCALATLVCEPGQVAVLRAVFVGVFLGGGDPAEFRGQRGEEHPDGVAQQGAASGKGRPATPSAGRPSGQEREATAEFRAVATAAESLRGKDFSALDAGELALLADLARRFRINTPRRASRRYRQAQAGRHVDLRATLRDAGRRGGYPLPLRRSTPRRTPRKLVVLCDISGSMEPYARALVALLHGALAGAGAEVFAFATRLTRLTPVLRAASPQVALLRAGQAAPDWSGGTRIADGLIAFNRHYGARGMARGAVVVIVSDGWETGDPAALGQAMARLSRLAYRIVWANPRTASSRYRPLAGGMAVAWPYCDAVVSAHNVTALDDLFAAIFASGRRRNTTPGSPTV